MSNDKHSNYIDTTTSTKAIKYILPIECSVLSSTPDASPIVDSNAESEELLLSTYSLTCKYRERTKIYCYTCKNKNYTGTTGTKISG